MRNIQTAVSPHPLKTGHMKESTNTQQIRIPSQPTCGDTKATDAQQKAKKTLDLRPTRLG